MTIFTTDCPDVASLRTWLSGVPSNSADTYIGRLSTVGLYDLVSTGLNFTMGTTPVVLTAAPGASFIDNSPQSHALNFNSANGAAITGTGINNIYTTASNLTISRLQFQNTGGGSSWYLDTGASVTITQCISVHTSSGGTRNVSIFGVLNLNKSLLIGPPTQNNIYQGTGCSLTCSSCTIGAPSDNNVGQFIIAAAGSASYLNCAFFGSNNLFDGGGTTTYTTCMSDFVGPPTGVTGSETYANQVVNTTTASGDWREKAGANLQGAGTADSTNSATDIVGTARPGSVGTGWDIGAWQIAALAAAIQATHGLAFEVVGRVGEGVDPRVMNWWMPPVANIVVTPVAPIIPFTTPLGAIVATIDVSVSDGSAVQNSLQLGFGPPYFSDGGTFSLVKLGPLNGPFTTRFLLLINPNGPGVAADGSTVQRVNVITH